MSEVVARLARVHDIGKATTWFQQYIDPTTDDPTENPTHHAPLGGLVGYYALRSTGHDSEECLAGYVAVAKHHGALPDVAEYVYDRTHWFDNPSKNHRKHQIIDQVENIDEHVPDLAADIIDGATDGDGTWEEFVDSVRDRSIFSSIESQVVPKYAFSPDSRALSEEFYTTLLQCWSGLVLADKTCAADVPASGLYPERPDTQTLRAYIDELGGDADSPRQRTLNEKRSEARQDVLESVESFVDSEHDIATLTLPTGLGKTLTGLDAALSIRDQSDRNRIVYALPFTSIIDQVAEEIESIFEVTPTGDTLTVHHHLAETVTTVDHDAVRTDENAAIEELLGESWRTGLVVTTFVQLFESLVGPSNAQSLKLPALYESVVVLDEPQGIPHDWWPLVEHLAGTLTEEYGAAVLAMTATQPEIFGDQAPELVSDPEKYFRGADRVSYTIDDSVVAFPDSDAGPVGMGAAANRLASDVERGDGVLAVCNTIDSAQELTTAVVDRVDGLDLGATYGELLREGERPTVDALVSYTCDHSNGPVLGHLTTRLPPKDRLTLIQAIKELRDLGHPVAVVSTQLIEAGVDVSFDRVYRDLAPLDSLVQAAGRCNRSFERKRGEVTVWWLESPADRETTPSEAVYEQWGDSLLSVTVGVLESEGIIDTAPRESGVDPSTVAYDAIDTYYRTLIQERNVGKREYVEYLERGECTEAGELSLIDRDRAVDVVVCRTEADRVLVREIKDAWSRCEYDRLQDLIDDTKPLQVSVPVYDESEASSLQAIDRVHADSELRWTAPDQSEFESWFDDTTGLTVPDSTVVGRFL